MEFYNKLCEWTDNDGVDDYLIDTSLIEPQTVNLNGSKRNLRSLTAFEIVSDGKMTQEVYNYYFSSFTTAIGAFDRDHPEVFWLNGKVKSYYGVNDTEDGKKKYIFYLIVSSDDGFTVLSDEYPDASSVKSGIQKRDQYISSILGSAPSGNYQKVKYFNKWLTENNEYNTIVAGHGSGEAQSVYECISALEGIAGVDGPAYGGYARAMKVLCDRSGIPCILVDGKVGEDEDHMWNYIQMGDGNWYLVDVTRNDPAGESSGAISGAECEDYLLIGSNNPKSSGRTITNQTITNGVQFVNQPNLAANDYVPSADEVGSAVLEADEGAVVWYIDNEKKVKQVNNGDKLEWGGGIRVEIPVSVAPTKPNIFIDNMLNDCYLDGAYWVTGDIYCEVPVESKMTVKFNLQDDAIDFVERLYQNTLDRGSDPSGLKTHVRDLKNGDSASTVAYRFVFSNEFQNANLSNEEIVKRMYKMFLSRDPDPAGLENWVNILEKGCSVGYLFYGFTQSKEFGELCDSYGFVRGNWQPEENRDKSPNLTAFVSRLYEKILGRTPDVGGLNNHTGAYLENRDTYQLAYNFIFSSEFTNKKLSDSDYVDTLYRTFFNREPDDDGKADWLNRITTQGYSREDVLAGFVGSQECIDLVNSFGI